METGGGNDYSARLVAQAIGSELGQQMVVENRGAVAGEIAAKAAPDGYTVLFYGSPL